MSDISDFIGVHDWPYQAYSDLEAWGAGSLKAMRKGPPARVVYDRAHPSQSAAMGLGIALHTAILEAERFPLAYVHKPEGMSFATKDGKAWREAQDGRQILSHDDWTVVDGMRQALLDKPLVADALTACADREQSIVWLDELTGEPCKGRIDAKSPDCLYDVKVSRYAGGDLAYRAFVDGWMHQLAHYRTGLQTLGRGLHAARLIVVHPVAPHWVYTLEVKENALDLLAIENSQTIEALRRCRLANDWPGTPDEWRLVEPPATALIATTVLENVEEIDA